jgi:hypothetical protein
MTRLKAKDTFMRLYSDPIITTCLENKPKVDNMFHSLVRVSSNIINVRFNYVLKIMKHKNHGMLKGFFGIFKDDKHLPV